MTPLTSEKRKQRPHRPCSPEAVLAELRQRAAAGRSLASGANHGDWLYAAAVRFFGCWGAAVEAAGFHYGDFREADLSADDALRRIRRAAEAGLPLRSGNFPLEASAARRHFGSWEAAVEAAGCALPSRCKWTADDVLARIREDLTRGLSLGTMAVLARDPHLYSAARRRFGNWAAALAVAAPSVPPPRRGRPARRNVQPAL
jgi:hypothetical protein